MKRNVWILVLAFAALLVASSLGPTYATVALAISAVLVLLVILQRLPKALPWRLAAVGAGLWALEEVAWAVNRLYERFEPSVLTDVSYYLGAAAWLAALLLLPGKRLPRRLVVASIPAVGLVAWLLAVNLETAVALQFPLVEFMLLLVALPVLGGLMKGGASEGRLLLVFGFFFRALAASSYTWLGGGTDPDFLLLWQLGYLCMGIGIFMELNDLHIDFVAAGVVVVTLQIAAARLLVFLYQDEQLANSRDVLVVIGGLAFLQLLVVIVILVNNNERHMRLLQQQRAWSGLLERVMSAPFDGLTLESLMDRALKSVSTLNGIEVHGRSKLGELTGYSYPLVTGGTEIGRLYFERQPETTLALDDSAPVLAARIQQLQEHHHWRTAALTDPLTNLLNRRGLEVRAPGLMGDARRNGKPVSVALIDIDHFKRVNDVYGHATGDLALRALAELLERHIRPNDIAVRWGGEEFLVVLRTDMGGAIDAMKRLRRELSGTPMGEVAWPLAASVGLAGGICPPADTTLTEWLEKADAALMTAKAQGRNRIEVAHVSEPAADAPQERRA